MMRRLAVGLLLFPSVVSGAGPDKVVAVTKEQVAWQATPGMAGGPMTAIEWGDPAAGAYEALFKFAAGYQLPAHFHKFDEVVTVVSGSVLVGGGDSVDEAKGVAVGPGGSFTIPAKTAHWARALAETVILRYSPGPREMTVLKDGEKAPGNASITVVQAKDVVWENGPGLVSGVETSLQYGDPKTGPYLILLKLPRGLVNPPHWHGASEVVTVLSGTMITGEGETVDDRTGKSVPAGGYFVIPAKTAHWGKAAEDVVLARLGDGPQDINYFKK
jgi:quercetin dioxygenase-like cupin family protein